MIIHACTIALSAFLLFLLQPVIARQILPWFGGSAAVWTTCMVFFQVTLLAGYAYSDLLIRRLAPRRQAIVHATLLIASLACLPITAEEAFKPADPDNPIGRILMLLAVTVGLPYLMLSTTGPLVQAWAARQHAGGRAYRLYALSNLASMLALLAYPPLIEPNASSAGQSIGWSAGYAAFVALALLATWRAAREGAGAPAPTASAVTDMRAEAPGLREQVLWMLLAMLGSVFLLAVTTHVTQNVASIPFLWVLPLSLYLLSFILCFDGQGWYWRRTFTVAGCLAAVVMLAGLGWTADWTNLRIGRGLMAVGEAVPLYSLGLFLICMFCHGELVRRKPPPAQLTRFYLMVSLGGAAGGMLVGVGAPLAFNGYWELPLALAAFTLMALFLADERLRPVAAAAFCLALLAFADHVLADRFGTIEASRNFYGTLRVRGNETDRDPDARWTLVHGAISHGEQFRSPQRAREPIAYFGETSGVGRALLAIQARSAGTPTRVGVVGLGAGTLAAHGRPGDVYRFYELNPSVDDIARRRFTYLRDSHADVETVLGDARLMLEREPAQRFDLLAIDAFSGDSIPVHLLTREAALLYGRHVPADGIIAVHITNRYLELAAICRQLADALGRQALRIVDQPPAGSGRHRSDWVLISANAPLLEGLKADGVGVPIDPVPGLLPWTDQYNNLFQVLK